MSGSACSLRAIPGYHYMGSCWPAALPCELHATHQHADIQARRRNVLEISFRADRVRLAGAEGTSLGAAAERAGAAVSVPGQPQSACPLKGELLRPQMLP